MPQRHSLSALKESAVLKADPTLWALRILSSTSTSPDPGNCLYSSTPIRPSSIFNNFLSVISS